MQAGNTEEVAQPIADTVLINGGIYTVDEERSWVEAAAVIDGSFVAVGSNGDIKAMIGPVTNVIDLTGSMALPGFHDAHVHPTMGGYALMGCMLEEESTINAVIQKVTTCVTDGEDGWLQGHAFPPVSQGFARATCSNIRVRVRTNLLCNPGSQL